MSRPGEFPGIQPLVSLPETGQGAGLLHGVVCDEAGALYCSDEINHSIISLDPEGHLRWRHCTMGSNPCSFHYPRGLSLGHVTFNGAKHPCLAVADAWNDRIQFLDLDGTFLVAWHQAGGTALREPSDIRFIKASAEEGSNGSFWLVLDRGNHRLCALDGNGNLLFQIGQGLPPRLRRRWAEPQILNGGDFSQEKRLPAYTRHDGLYYPERILGQSEDCLSLWEPFSRSMQLVLDGNTLPLSIGTFPDGVWIAADRWEIVEWSPHESSLRWHGFDGTLLAETAIIGRPVPSNLPPASVWVQEGRNLTLVNRGPTIPRPAGGLGALLLQGASGAMKSFDIKSAQESVHSFDLLAREVTALGHLASETKGEASTTEVMKAAQRLEELVQESRVRTVAVAEAMHPLCLAALELRLGAAAGADLMSHAVFSEWRETAQQILSILCRGIRDMDAAGDELERHRAQRPAPEFQRRGVDAQRQSFLERLQGTLCGLRSWLQRWSAPPSSLIEKSTPGDPVQAVDTPRGTSPLTEFGH